jgi:outer membrane protein assembly factor BamE (lipoprotein component of BamABCDE complex)
MKKNISVFLISTAIVLSGCSTVESMYTHKQGTQITQEQLKSVVHGKSTKEDIERLFGVPHNIQELGGDTHYVYEYMQINPLSPSVNESKRFVFDKKGVLKKVMSGTGGIKSPLGGL